MAFRVRNVFGTFEKRTPRYKIGKGKKKKEMLIDLKRIFEARFERQILKRISTFQ